MFSRSVAVVLSIIKKFNKSRIVPNTKDELGMT